jgi:tetratricopeptide (TPR) repeat protein
MRKTLWILTLSALIAGEASALEVTFDEETRAMVAVGVPPAPEVPADATEGAEAAPAPEPRELWRYPNYYRDGQATPPAPVVATVGGEELVVHCVDGYLSESRASTGVVRFRRLLPGTCLGLEAAGSGQVRVTLDPRFLGFFGAKTEATDAPTTLTYTPGEHARGDEVLPRVGSYAFVADAQASNVLSEMAAEDAPEDGRQEWISRSTDYGGIFESGEWTYEAFDEAVAWRTKTEEGKAWSKRALDAMVAGGAMDPTNPWFAFYEGMVRWELGQRDEARAAFARLTRTPPDLAHETIRMLPKLARAGVDAEVVSALRAHVGEALLEGGYEPELSRSAIWLALYWRGPGPKLDPKDPRELAVADSYVEDWALLAPHSEGVALAMHAVAQGHRAAGDTERADAVDRLADANPGDLMTTGSADIDWAMYAIPLPPALSFAVVVLLLVGALRRVGMRYVPEDGEGGEPWWLKLNPLAATNRLALAGMLVLMGAALYTVWRMALGIWIVGSLASAPMGLDANQLGAQDTAEFLETFEATPDVIFYEALQRQHAGDLEGAEALYSESGTARAWNNLGTLAHRAGDAAGAEAAWAKALAGDPELEEARYNTSGAVSGARSARAERYAPGTKLMALPTPQMRAAMLERRARAELAGKDPIEVFSSASSMGGQVGGSDVAELAPSLFAQLLAALLILFGMLAPRRGYRLEARPLEHKAQAGVGLFGWVAGLLTPGGAHAYGPLRPWLLGATLTSAALFAVTSRTGGATSSILVSIAKPAMQRLTGVEATLDQAPAPIDAQLMAFGEWWWALALGLALLGFALEYVWPDPAGLIARKRAERND